MKDKRKRVSHYILNEQLNKGNHSTVYKGVDTNTGEERAIKVINNSDLDKNRQKKAINREIQIMLNLKHENIVKLYDHLETCNNNYLVLELCKNGDLSQFTNGIGEERTVVYLKQIIKALKVLHEYNIIHRDLKPANIFIAEDSRVKLGDFGLARTINIENLAYTCVGTPYYMSPEILSMRSKGTETYDFKSDIWSLGCIVYELITGHRPFPVGQLDDLIPCIKLTISSSAFLKEKGFSGPCMSFLQQIFKFNPEERISFEEICQHQFILGMPSIKGIVYLNGIQCLSDNPSVLTAEDALELAAVVQKTAEYCLHPFLLYMKACVCLKPYLYNEKCKQAFQKTFQKAKFWVHKTDWEASSISRVILETVIHICRSDEEIPQELLRNNFKNAYILLKTLKNSPYISSLKESLRNQIGTI
jgi:serine/threonine protein kinase